jgi:hypothetical protein
MSDFVQVKNFITDDECNDLIKFYDTSHFNMKLLQTNIRKVMPDI